MTVAIVSEKGQLTLPSSIRKEAHIHPGTRIEVEIRDNEIVLRPIKSLSELGGVLQPYLTGQHSSDYETMRDVAMAARSSSASCV